jgi:hypothetical protein
MNIDFLLIVGSRIAPGLRGLDERSRAEARRIIVGAIASRSAAVQRQLGVFLKVLRYAPVVRYGRLFERLTSDQQDAVLGWFQNAPAPRLRQGFWGVKTLIFMGYYGRPEVGGEIAYHPSRSGNDLLNAR